MKKIIYAVGVALIFSACQSKKMDDNKNDSTSTSTAPAVVAPVQLTEQQKTEGWKLLFDGVSKTGWRTFKNKPNDSWEVIDGTLHCKPFKDSVENQRADLVTVDQYDNFELAFDWKISSQGNSGVMFRVSEEFDEPYATGPEYQILDDGGYPGEVLETNLSATAYGVFEAKNKKLNPVGEWNQAKIIANGNHIEHWLNGQKVVDYEINSPEWKKRRDKGKWKDFPAYATMSKGFVDLQDHGNEVWFKNIMIKPL
jgi:hypothetical protein